MVRGVVLFALAACGRVDFDPPTHATTPPDAVLPLDGGWSTPMPIPGAASGADEDDGSMSPSGRELAFTYTSTQIEFLERASTSVPFDTTAVVFDQGSPGGTATPRYDGEDTLYFTDGATGAGDIYRTTRTAPGATTWTSPVELAFANDPTTEDKWYQTCAGGTRYVMVRLGHDTAEDLYEGEVGQPAVLIAALSTDLGDTSPYVLPDCNTIYFASSGYGPSEDLLVAQRADLTAPWGPPIRLGDLDDPNAVDEDPWLSADGHTVIFASDRAGQMDLYTATR